MKEYVLVFGFNHHKALNYFLPQGYIVERNNGYLGFIVKIANADTLASYNVHLTDVCRRLLELSESISKQALLKKYNAKTKKAKPLDLLMKEAGFKRGITQYIDLILNRFFDNLKKTKIPIAIPLDRTMPFETQQVPFSEVVLEPKFYFQKTTDFLEYQLTFFEHEKEIFPSEQDLVIVLDNPALITYNHKLYSLNNINANKLTPFLTKKVLQIPNKNSSVYFNKFIKKIIKKSPIEAKGFKVVKFNTCTACIIKPTTTIFSSTYVLELFFEYENHTFSITDQSKKHVKLTQDDNEEFTVFETERNFPQEKVYISHLEELGVSFLSSNLGTFEKEKTSDDIYVNISKLIELQNKFTIPSIRLDLKMFKFHINNKTSYIASNYTPKNDWFDVEMIIHIGTFNLPFASLIPCLKNGERLYKLPDGTCFLIPREWFERFHSLINFGKVTKNTITIQKNQFPLLEHSEIATQEDIIKDIIPYQHTKHLKARLRDYQVEGANWMIRNYQLGYGSCLADDMGLGKTLQTIAYLDFVFHRFEKDFSKSEMNPAPDLFSVLEIPKKSLKALVVCPSSLTFNWDNEIHKFCPHFSTLSYIGPKRKALQSFIAEKDILLTSYGTLLRDIEFLKTLTFNFLIIDESQQIKNRNSKIYKAINTINTEHKISLSGTPIENSLSDLWSQMQFINPNLLGNFAFFNKHFKKPIEKERNEEKIHELKSLIDPYLLRRTKKEVAKDLPDITEQIFYSVLAPKQAKLYEEEKSKVRNFILEKKYGTQREQNKDFKLSVLNSLLKLRQMANHPLMMNQQIDSGKFKDVTAYLETLIQARQKTLIFSSFTSHLDIYTKWCKAENISYNLLTGKTKVWDRELQVKAFEENEDNLLFFISLKAGGTGLNLTSASYVIILDPWWNPFAELQAIGRAHRIGQTQHVNVVRFIAKDTIEEKINQLQQTKKVLFEDVIEAQIKDEILDDIEGFLG